MRCGQAMAVRAPVMRDGPVRRSGRAQRGRLHFAHSDLAGCQVFEMAFTLGRVVA